MADATAAPAVCASAQRPGTPEGDAGALRLRHQKVLYWGAGTWHEYRDIRRLCVLKPPRRVSVPDPAHALSQQAPHSSSLPAPDPSRYIEAVAHFKGQVSMTKILSRRQMREPDDDLTQWPEAYFVCDTWYFHRPGSTVIQLDPEWHGTSTEIEFPLVQCDHCQEYARVGGVKFIEVTADCRRCHFCSQACLDASGVASRCQTTPVPPPPSQHSLPSHHPPQQQQQQQQQPYYAASMPSATIPLVSMSPLRDPSPVAVQNPPMPSPPLAAPLSTSTTLAASLSTMSIAKSTPGIAGCVVISPAPTPTQQPVGAPVPPPGASLGRTYKRPSAAFSSMPPVAGHCGASPLHALPPLGSSIAGAPPTFRFSVSPADDGPLAKRRRSGDDLLAFSLRTSAEPAQVIRSSYEATTGLRASCPEPSESTNGGTLSPLGPYVPPSPTVLPGPGQGPVGAGPLGPGLQLPEMHEQHGHPGPQQICRQCRTAPVDTIFLWCGHSEMCAACGAGVTSCPVCSAPVAKVNKILPASSF
eukprot:m51a1_g2528 hypothetical protein (527) ;mRNA; f:235842-238293